MDFLTSIMSGSDSTLLLTVVIFIGGAFVLRPLIKLFVDSKERTAKSKQDAEMVMKEKEFQMQRELLKVVSSSVEVNTALKTLIEQNYNHCDNCKLEQMSILTKINEDVGFVASQLKYVDKRKEVRE